MTRLIQFEIRPDADFPPAAADILLIPIASGAILAHGHIRVPFEIIQIRGADIRIALLEIPTRRESDSRDEAIHAFLPDLDAVFRRVIRAGHLAVCQLDLRLHPETVFFRETLPILDAKAVPIGIIIGIPDAGADALVRVLHVRIFRDKIQETAVVSQIASVNSKASVCIVTASRRKRRAALCATERQPNHPIGRIAASPVIADLVVIVLILDLLRAVLALAARHPHPYTLRFLAGPELAEAFIHIIVFLPPRHQGHGRHIAHRAIRGIFVSDDAIGIHLPVSIDLRRIAAVDIIGFRFHLTHQGNRRLTFTARRLHDIRQILQIGVAGSNLICQFTAAFHGDSRLFILTRDRNRALQCIRRDRPAIAVQFFNLDRIVCPVERQRPLIQCQLIDIEVRPAIQINLAAGSRHLSAVDRFHALLDRNFTAVRSRDSIDKTIVRHIPCSTILDIHGEPCHIAVILIIILQRHAMCIITICLISGPRPRRTLATQIDIHIRIDQIAAPLRASRCIRRLEAKIPLNHRRMLSVDIDICRRMTTHIDGNSIFR